MPGEPSHVFTIPRSFSPTYSLIGRLIARRAGDRLRGEALYIFVVTMAIVVWLLAGFVAWAILEARIASNPGGPTSLSFFGLQIAVPALTILVAGIGFRPAIRVELYGRRLIILRGTERHDLPLDNPFCCRTLDAVSYHRGLRRLDTTRPFINRPVDVVLAIETGDETVVLGLARKDCETLEALLSGFTSGSASAYDDTVRAPSECGVTRARNRITSSISDVTESGSG